MVALGEVDMSGYHLNPQITHEVNGIRARKNGEILKNGIRKVLPLIDLNLCFDSSQQEPLLYFRVKRLSM